MTKTPKAMDAARKSRAASLTLNVIPFSNTLKNDLYKVRRLMGLTHWLLVFCD